MPDLGCGMQDLLWDHSANHSSIAAWRVPWTEEPGRLQSMGSESDMTEWARDHWTSQVARVVKNPPTNAGDARDPSLIPGSGRSSGVGNGNTLQYSCLGNSMNRGDWWATVHRVPALDTTKWLNTHTHRIICCSMQTRSCSMWDLVPWPGTEAQLPTLGAHWTIQEVPPELSWISTQFSQLLQVPFAPAGKSYLSCWASEKPSLRPSQGDLRSCSPSCQPVLRFAKADMTRAQIAALVSTLRSSAVWSPSISIPKSWNTLPALALWSSFFGSCLPAVQLSNRDSFRFFFFFFFVVGFVIHWNESAMGLHVFPIPIPPPTSLSTRSL